MKNGLKAILAVAAVASLSGCVVAPPGPGYYGGPVVAPAVVVSPSYGYYGRGYYGGGGYYHGGGGWGRRW